jgi:NADH-quinone oxidoreductase subunit A
MSTSEQALVVLAVFLLGGLLFCLVPLGLAWLWAAKFSPRRPGLVKNATYECGLASRGEAWIQYQSEYYLCALLFLVFDVEAVFLLPFAVAFTGLELGAGVAMLVFVLLLAEGLVWAWHKGVLSWR